MRIDIFDRRYHYREPVVSYCVFMVRSARNIHIDLVRDYLFDLDEQERLEKISELHMKMEDAELLTELETFIRKHPSTMHIRYKNVNQLKPRMEYDTKKITHGKVADELTTIFSISFNNLNPIWRYYFHYFLKNKHLISEFESNLKSKCFNESPFIVDFVSSKSTNMKLPVFYNDEIRMLAADFFTTLTHSISVTSIQSTELKIYAKNCNAIKKNIKSPDFINHSYFNKYFSDVKRDNDKTLINNTINSNIGKFHLTILNEIEKIVISDIKRKTSFTKQMSILMKMYYIKEYVREESKLNHKTAFWIKSDTSMQNFLYLYFPEYIKINLNDQKQFCLRKYDFKLFSDFEQLVCWGLVDHVHKPVIIDFKAKIISDIEYTYRIDRVINQSGEELCDLLANSLIDEAQKLKGIVFSALDTYLDEYKNLRDVQIRAKQDEECIDSPYEYETKIKKSNLCILKFV